MGLSTILISITETCEETPPVKQLDLVMGNCGHMLNVDNITERQQQHNPNWRVSALGHRSDHHMSHVHPNIYNRNWKYWQIFHIKLF